MSKRYKGAILSSTPPTTSTSSASGVWTEQQFMQGVASGSWPALAGAPTIGTATAGALSASVTFTAPTYTGSGITGYTVTSSPGGITGTGASSPVTVSGLTAGTAYTFTVTATTAAGQGPASAASNSVTPTAPNYIEDVFSTYLYTGNGSTQTITNGIDLSGQGGLVWYKDRTSSYDNELVDTVRGAGYNLESDNTTASTSRPTALTAFTSTGFTLGSNVAANGSGDNFVSWTFRKQPKFFDVVTWTGNGAATQTISHNLGSVPGCIIAKVTSTTGNWFVYHRATSATPLQDYTRLNLTNATNASGSDLWGATSTTITVDSGLNLTTSGATYVAYIFAHNAGGFGLTGTDNVISCGSFTTDASGLASINLGYEPQWVLYKRTNASEDWFVRDNMRGWSKSTNAFLRPNLSDAELVSNGDYTSPNATGFQAGPTAGAFSASSTYMYIAIRRGPMKVPTSGTSVFSPVIATQSGNTTISTGFPVDFVIANNRAGANHLAVDRLRGGPQILQTASTAAEVGSAGAAFDYQTSILWKQYADGVNGAFWNFGRAPSFFDEVCYTGTGSATTVTHNLGVVPELMIAKVRSTTSQNWPVYSATLGASQYVILDQAGAAGTDTAGRWGGTAPTSTVFSVGATNATNGSGNTYVWYGFASCPGVSKVGSYTGTGATQTIDCSFTGGARWVMIKRTDTTGDWYVWDTARGMVSGTDPSLLMNSTAAEVNANSVYTTSVGFQIVSTAAGINASGGTYIYLAIA